MYNDKTKGLFNIHELENDSTKVLVELDIPTLMTMMCCWGNSTDKDIHDIMQRWGFSFSEARSLIALEPGGQYTHVKTQVTNAYRKYLDYLEKQEKYSDEIPF